MRRIPEIDPFAYYHVGTRGNYGRPLFTTPDEHELYLKLFARASRKRGWLTLEWALIANHLHFIIKLTDGGLSEGMREVNSCYSRRIHAITGETGKGHLVRHCFFAAALDTEAHLKESCRYVSLNAVRAGLCDAADEWRWGGYRAVMGLEHAREFHHVSELLSLFGKTPGRARTAYRRFVADGLVQEGPVLTSEQGYELVPSLTAAAFAAAP